MDRLATLAAAFPTVWPDSAASTSRRPASDGRHGPTSAHRIQKRHCRAPLEQEPGVCHAAGLLNEPSLVGGFPAIGRNGSHRRCRPDCRLPRGQQDMRGGVGAEADFGQLRAERRSLCRRRNQARRRAGRRRRATRRLRGSVAAAGPTRTIRRRATAVLVSRNRRLAWRAAQVRIDVRLRILLRLRRTNRALRPDRCRGTGRTITPTAGRGRRNGGKLAGNRRPYYGRRASRAT